MPPPHPQCPLQTHSAPPLPESSPLDIYGFCRGEGGNHRRSCSHHTCRERGQLHFTQSPETAAPLLQRPVYSTPQLSRSSWRGGVVVNSASPGVAREHRARGGDLSTSVAEAMIPEREKESVAGAATLRRIPTSTSTNTTRRRRRIEGAATTVPTMKQENLMTANNVAPSPAASTTYEAALKEYGKRLLSMTQKQKRMEEQQSRELLNRRKAVKEKYSDLSRPPPPPTTTCDSGRRRTLSATTTTKHNGSSNNGCGHAGTVERRGSGFGNPSPNPRSSNAESESTHRPRNELRKKMSFGMPEKNDHLCCTCKGSASVAPVTPFDTRANKRGECQQDGVAVSAASSDSEGMKVEIELEDVRTHAKRCVCGSSWDASTDSRIKRDGWSQTEASSFVTSPAISFFSSHQREASKKARTMMTMKSIQTDNFDDMRYIAPPYLTPPRPLRYTYDFLDSHSNILRRGNSRKGSNILRHFPHTTKAHDDESWEYSLSAAAPKVRKNSRSGGSDYRIFSQHIRPKEMCRAYEHGLVFIRPQPEPRPLSYYGEIKQQKEDNFLWSARELSFRGPTWSNEEKERDTIGMASSESFFNPQRERDMERKQRNFTNVVPQYVLDGFARRNLLRMAWRRWRERLWEHRLLPPTCFNDVAVTDVENDGGSRWAGLETWLVEAALPSAAQ